MLQDRLVCGVRDVRVQCNLLAKPNLNFKTAFELAQVAEVAKQNAKDLQKLHAQVAPVHTVQKQHSRQDRRNCYLCGGIQSTIVVTKRDISPRSAVPRQKRNNIRNDEPVRTGSQIAKHFARGEGRWGRPHLHYVCIGK